MRIQDAKPGDVLRDVVGDMWLVLEDGECIGLIRSDDDGRCYSPVQDILDAVDCGPFTRLVPEVEPTNA